MKINQKRALSDIITTVLIILLAIAAVVMIWGFIKKPIEQGGQQIQTSTDCFALKVVPTGCLRNTTTNYTDLVTLTAKWAEGSAKLQQIKFVLTDNTGKSLVNTTAAPASILETTSVVVNASTVAKTGLSLTAVGVIQSADGTLVPCTNSQQESLACS